MVKLDTDKIRKEIFNKRIEKGLSAEELAKKVGVSKTTIYRYESGEIKKMPLQNLYKLSEALDINPLFLSGLSQNAETKKTQSADLVAAHIDDGLTDEEMAKILDYIDMIKKTHKE